MRYRLIRFLPGIQVHWHLNETLWASRGYDILVSPDSGQTYTRIATIPVRMDRQFLARFGPFRRLLRLGIRSYLQLSDRELIVFCHGNIFLWRQGDIHPSRIGSVRQGSGPLLQGCCSDNEGNCYYGEYWRNPERGEVNIYTCKRGSTDWSLFYSFPQGTIRHIHAVQFDPFSKNIWIATGDRDSECKIGYFETSSVPLQPVIIASGKQMARAVSLLFTRDYVYWGSDGGRGTDVTANYIYRWSRLNKKNEQIAKLGGPIYYSTVDQEERLFVSTTVEGAVSEGDRYARVWISLGGLSWNEIGRWKKDRYPFIFGYAVLSFSRGLTSGARMYVAGSGVQGGSGTWILEVADNIRKTTDLEPDISNPQKYRSVNNCSAFDERMSSKTHSEIR